MKDGKARRVPLQRYHKQDSSKYWFCVAGWKIGTRRTIRSREIELWQQVSSSAIKLEDYAAGMERIAAALGVSENGPSEFKFEIDGLLYELAARCGHFESPESMKHC